MGGVCPDMGEEMPEENEQQQSETTEETGQQQQQTTESQTDTETDTDSGTDWEAEMKKWRSLARKHEATANKNAAKLKEYDDANKSEVERLKDDLTAREVELNELRVDAVRRKAVANAGLDPELAEFITATDDQDALEQAQKLAKRLTPAQKEQGGQTQRRTVDLRQGNRGGGNESAEVSRDSILRAWAGYQE